MVTGNLSPGVRRRLRTVLISRQIMKHWLLIFIIGFGILNVLPFVAPIAMRLGWAGLGKTIYTLYAPLCHQMAQRSFFLFSSQIMYSPDQFPIELLGNLNTDLLTLRAFTGNDLLGWKVAWSDRMVYMYGSLWLASIAYGLYSRKSRMRQPISLIVFILLLLPMAVDGGTHLLSDLDGITQGFRYDNVWLASLTGGVFSDTFYSGDAFGSFNSWMRLLTGVLFGVACAALGLPLIDEAMRMNVHILTAKLNRRAERQQMPVKVLPE